MCAEIRRRATLSLKVLLDCPRAQPVAADVDLDVAEPVNVRGWRLLRGASQHGFTRPSTLVSKMVWSRNRPRQARGPQPYRSPGRGGEHDNG